MSNNNNEMMLSEKVVEEVTYSDCYLALIVNTCPMNVGERN